MNEQITISKEVFSEISELLSLADTITNDVLRLGLNKNPKNIPNYSLQFAKELSGKAWSNELVELLKTK